ncbi:MAG: 4-(cytidine 5'-diphospho)-2-C-methyl-D-erythritol kinase [Planctomycetes bacterium]|nr:4-(cytidine 5'-diphospho)-2-C-methyl-D-erythritol kinase [Planctomycetota bacterium]
MLEQAAPAKINLFLEVTGRRDDGYHDIDSVFLEIDLADTLAVEPARRDISLILADGCAGVPGGGDNLVVRAAEALRNRTGVSCGARFTLSKRIPMASGLGGGSSNAAAALLLANQLWNTGLSRTELAAIGSGIGSDVPFFLHGGACLCQGRGELIQSLPEPETDLPICLVLSGIESHTGAAYRGLSLPGPGEAKRASLFAAALAAGDVTQMARLAFNRFEPTVFAAIPRLAGIHARLRRAGLEPRLSGSGSALWYFGDKQAGQQALTDEAGVEIIQVKPFARRRG